MISHTGILVLFAKKTKNHDNKLQKIINTEKTLVIDMNCQPARPALKRLWKN